MDNKKWKIQNIYEPIDKDIINRSINYYQDVLNYKALYNPSRYINYQTYTPHQNVDMERKTWNIKYNPFQYIFYWDDEKPNKPKKKRRTAPGWL